jgi:hypothetical protein
VIPATQESKIGRIEVRGQPRQKGRDPISTNKIDMVVCTCHPSYTGTINRRIQSRLAQAKMQDPIPKITKAKRA